MAFRDLIGFLYYLHSTVPNTNNVNMSTLRDENEAFLLFKKRNIIQCVNLNTHNEQQTGWYVCIIKLSQMTRCFLASAILTIFIQT